MTLTTKKTGRLYIGHPLNAKEPIRKDLYRRFFFEGRNLRMGLAQVDVSIRIPIYESRNLRMGLA